MAHLWIEQEQEWSLLPLGVKRVVLERDPKRPARAACSGETVVEAALLPPATAGGTEWTLICRPGRCRVNGEPVTLGIRALSNRDEIQVALGTRLFFSTETQARIISFPGAERAAFCPRCLQEITVGQPAVLCPRCGVAYHEDTESEPACWTYAPCALCGQSSAMDADFHWTPEAL